MAAAEPFLSQSCQFLRDDYLPRIRVCLERLTTEQLWWRPHEQANSIGNLILHLAGNVRQWIGHGVGGAADGRDRQAEFDARERRGGEELGRLLEQAVSEAAEVLEGLGPEDLEATREIQGNQVTVRYAVYHVVEHFAMHTGQILYATKLQTGQDLGLYRISHDGKAQALWKAGDGL